MKKTILLIGLLAIVTGSALADVLTLPGFGHGLINTPVAWNSTPTHWRASAFDSFGGSDLADSGGFSFLYSRNTWEYGGGYVSAADDDNSSMWGLFARLNVAHTDDGLFATVLGGYQKFSSDSGDESTQLGSLILGQKFENFGLNFSGTLWSNSGEDANGGRIKNDLEVAGNLLIDLDHQKKWTAFVEAYDFTDADKAGRALGLIWQWQDNILLNGAWVGVTNPDNDSRFELGVTYTFKHKGDE